MQAYRAIILAATAVVAAACRGGAPQDPTGEWTVVGHRIPGISAMSDADASAWHGRIVRFSADGARSGAASCPRPKYREREVRTDSLLTVGFGVASTALGPPDSVPARLRLTDVFCKGVPWASMGGRLLWTGADRAWTMWDGVFFDLRRNR